MQARCQEKRKAPIEYEPATDGGIKPGRASGTLPRGTEATLAQAEWFLSIRKTTSSLITVDNQSESGITNFFYFYYCNSFNNCSIIVMTLTNNGGRNGEKKTGRETKGTF
jgi:hypothetical protein